jgi:RHS repeat-associated protein
VQTASGQTLVVEQDYDAEGNLLSVVRRDGGDLNIASGWTYDGAGRKLTENTSGIPNVYKYDAAGNLRFHTTPRLVTIEQTFDALNRLTPGQSFPQTTCHPGAWSPTSDCFNATNTFPKFGTSVAIPTDVAVFDYDDDGNVIRADNRDAQIRRTYYGGGALNTDTLKARRYTDDGYTGDDLYAESKTTLTYRYDLSGRRKSLTTSSVLGGACGSCVQQYAYTPGLGALETVTAPDGQTFTYRYDRVGQPYRFESPGNVTTWQYDGDGRVRSRSQTAAGLSHQETFSYDARGKSTLVSAQRSGTAPITVRNAYDALGALVMTSTANIGAIELEEWTVDALANVLTYTRNRHSVATTVLQSNTIDQSSGRLERTEPLPPPHLADGQRQSESQQDYDNSGNVRWTASRQSVTQGGVPHDIGATVYTMSWYGGDEKLRVYQRSSVDTAPGLASAFEEYRYDALGRRVLMSSRPFPACNAVPCLHVVDYYVWDGDQLLLERRRGTNASGAVVHPSPYTGTVLYVHGLELDQPLALIKDDVIQPQRDWRGHYDGGLTLSGQAFVQGVTWPGGNLSAYLLERVPAQSLGWQGSLIQGKKDPSGLIYMRNRYYDPASGRFTQQDPIGLAGGLNLYGFANGDPVNFSDPFGLCANPLAGGLGGLQCAIEDVMNGIKAGPGVLAGMAKVALTNPIASGAIFGALGEAGAGMRAGAAVTRASSVASRVLGHYPEYVHVGEAIGAKTFIIPMGVWNKMSSAVQWAANKKFLDRGIAEGAEFVMATRRGDIRAGSALAGEVDYLIKNGYRWAENGLSLIKQ